MSSNKSAKEQLIRLYGPYCFIEKLHLRKDKNRHYTSKGQMKRMKQLTYHHILERRNGGKATVENGALLSAENHQWFNQQSETKQAEMNRKFQEYKASFEECRLELIDASMEEISGMVIAALTFEPQDLFKEIPQEYEEPKREKYNRAKEKADLNRLKQEWEDR